PRGLRRFPEPRIPSPSVVIASAQVSVQKAGRKPGALPNFVSAAVYDLTSFFLPPFRQRRAEGWAPSAGPDDGSAALLPAVGWTAQRIVVKHIVRLHVEAGPVDQRDAGTVSGAALVVRIGGLVVHRGDVPQHDSVAGPAYRLAVEVAQQILVGPVPRVTPVVDAGAAAVFARIIVGQIFVVLRPHLLVLRTRRKPAGPGAIAGQELIAHQMSIVVALGCTLDHNAAEFQRVPVDAGLVGNRQLGIGSDITLGILDVNELQGLVIQPTKELGAHPPEWVVNVRLRGIAGKVVAGGAIAEADAAVFVEGGLG